MTRSRVGLTFEEDQVVVTAIRGPGRLEQFRLKPDETLSTRLASELSTRGLGKRRLRVGLDRSLAVVKTLELPRAAGASLRPMVAFELERHVPFSPQDIRFDCVPVGGASRSVRRVLVMAAEGRTVDGALRLLETLKRPPSSVTAACHDLPALLARRAAVGRVIWVHRHGERTDLLCMDRGLVRLSRRVLTGTDADLLADIGRTLPLVEWKECDAIWISGDDAERSRVALRRGAAGAPVSAPPFGRWSARLIARLPIRRRGAGLLALAVAAGRRRPGLDLLPGGVRARTTSLARRITAGLAAATTVLGLGLLLAHGHAQERYLARVSAEIQRLDPEVKAVERLGVQIAQEKRLLATLRSADSGGLRPLPVLRELTELIPTDAWLHSVSMDRQGIELTGEATTASQLIPLLDGSPSLERVEFTAPVTKVQAKEQFRIRASWEEPAAPRAGPLGGTEQ
ncbi:MAG TPA: PilN domain-containing protein [Candidatus Bathyarchaeia archaeon]|nr:PilN domain-containing protein [Candidatus Bathyarchaeia archaeon]